MHKRARMPFGVRLATSLLAFSLWAGNAFGITPENVIQMHKSGLPPEVIVQTLQSTGSTFQLSVNDLKQLKAAGVPESVISTMVGSSDTEPEPAPEPAPEPSVIAVPSEADLAAQSEEEARIRAAAQAAAEAERARIAEAERARLAGLASQAHSALKAKNYGEAAQRYDALLKEVPANSPNVAEFKLGLADSFYGLKLYGNAAETYHEVLSAGSDAPEFVPAFVGLRKCSKKISYNPVTLEALTGYYIGHAPEDVQNSYNYFLGKFFFEYNRNEEARRYLSEVRSSADDYADAQYLLGLIQVQEAGELPAEGDDAAFGTFGRTLVGATGYFQEAVDSAKGSDAVRIQSLAYLALARIAYSLGSFDAAIFYYRKVPQESTSYVDALHESGWSYFLKGDVRRGMGIFHTLGNPEWNYAYLPDIYLLEATVFMNNCHFDFANEAIQRIETRYLALAEPLRKFIDTYQSPEELYNAIVLRQLKDDVDLPKLLRMALYSHSEFYDLHTTVTSYRAEVNRLKNESSVLGESLAAERLARVESAHQEHTLALGIEISRILQDLSESLAELEVSVTEIRIEIGEDQADDLQRATEELYRGETKEASAAKSEQRATTFVGDKYVTWPFEGEYWGDEVNNYRSYLKDVCKR